MEEEIKKRFDAQDKLLEKIYVSAEKTRKYFLVVFIISLVTFVLPLIALIFVLPWFINVYISGLGNINI
ncbi:MAG: hypothetical protein GWO87_01770 [Xanthomonadaceae bacterium]|nr:hypothetical protein [Rhodospirillaceae bacterium]NIA17898.1 hypothetical protein [Xanthomonadaceae bacterium]